MLTCSDNVSGLIGNTPMMELCVPYEGKKFRFWAKAEFVNPSGSVKDRIAKHIIECAEKSGKLKKGSVIVEATSGNTGIALSMVAASKGYRMKVVMPSHMSKERIRIIKALGAEVILTPKEGGFLGAVAAAEKMGKEDKKVFLPRQFSNCQNVDCHRETTGKEILKQMKTKRVDAFVSGVGTGGTLMGVAETLRRKNPKVIIVAVEPAESQVMAGQAPGFHKIQGIGDDFIPDIVKLEKVDLIIPIASDDAICVARQLSTTMGLMCGISTGANVLATIRLMQKIGMNKNVVTILPDRCERYFSTDLYKGIEC